MPISERDQSGFVALSEKEKRNIIIEILGRHGRVIQNRLVDLAGSKMAKNTTVKTLRQMEEDGEIVMARTGTSKIYELPEPLKSRKKEFGRLARKAIKLLEEMERDYAKYPFEVRRQASRAVGDSISNFMSCCGDEMLTSPSGFDGRHTVDYEDARDRINEMIRGNEQSRDNINRMLQEDSGQNYVPTEEPVPNTYTQLADALDRGADLMRRLQQTTASIRKRMDQTGGNRSTVSKRIDLKDKLDVIQGHSTALVKYVRSMESTVRASSKDVKNIEKSYLDTGDENHSQLDLYSDGGLDHIRALGGLDYTIQEIKKTRDEFSHMIVRKTVPKTGSYDATIAGFDGMIVRIEKLRSEADRKYLDSMTGTESQIYKAVMELDRLASKIARDLAGNYKEFLRKGRQR